MARLRDLALFYRSFGQLLAAGVPPTRALVSSEHTLPAAAAVRARIEAGATLAEALADHPAAFPVHHVKLLAVAERTGRLDAALTELADFTDQLLELRRTILTGLLLPALILHVAGLVIPLRVLFLDGGLAPYVFAALRFLGTIWFVLGLGFVLVRVLPPAVLDAVVRPLPLVGRTWRELDLWRVASIMPMILNAGLGVIAGLRFATEVCRSPRLARALRQAADQAEVAGQPVSVALSSSGELPAEFLSYWTTGEESGRLDDMMQRLAARFAERCRLRMRELAKWLPRLAYAAVSVYLVVQIFRGATAYVNLLNSIE